MTHIGPTNRSGPLPPVPAGLPQPLHQPPAAPSRAASDDIVPGHLEPHRRHDAGDFDFEAGLAKLHKGGKGGKLEGMPDDIAEILDEAPDQDRKAGQAGEEKAPGGHDKDHGHHHHGDRPLMGYGGYATASDGAREGGRPATTNAAQRQQH